MFVKICANTSDHDAQLALESGAAAVGFVFAASKRQVTPAQVGTMRAGLGGDVERVGVFGSTSAAEIARDADVAQLTAVQLHSLYDAKLVQELHALRPGLNLIQVVSLKHDADAAEVTATLRMLWSDAAIFAVLLDAAQGGSGTTFNWERLAPAVHVARTSPEQRLIVAGGLHAGNVAEAIARFAPWGVDVASGVEQAPGTKDAAKLRAFVMAARSASVNAERPS